MMNRLPVETPAFVYDEACISADCARIAQLAHESGCKLLFSVKALALSGVLETVGHHVDGFSASSQFEALLVHNIVGPDAVTHTTCPGLRTQDLVGILRTSKYLSFNSVSQLERLGPSMNDNVQLGIRVNPGLSLLSDARYDPCRRHSKLGAALQEINAVFEIRASRIG